MNGTPFQKTWWLMDLHKALGIAIAHHNSGRFRAAEEIYRRILHRHEGHPIAGTLLGRLDLMAKRYDECWKHISAVVSQTKDYMQVYNLLGEYNEQMGRLDEATVAFRRALILTPNQANPTVSMGNLAQQSENSSQKDKMVVEKLYRWALICQPKSTAAANNLAAVLLQKQDGSSALRILENVLSTDPNNVRANAYKVVGLRGVGKNQEANVLVGFGSLVRTFNIANEGHISNLEKFNKELSRTLKNHPNLSSDWDPHHRAIRGGAVVPRLFDHKSEILEVLEGTLRQLIDGYVQSLPEDSKHPYLSRKPSNYELDIWANLLGPDDHQSAHIHNQGWMSGVYYVTVPSHIDASNPHAGWIEFNRPGYGLPCLGGDENIEVIEPKAGMVILFPSYVWHGTIPFVGTGERISIAFDLHM